MEGGGSGSRERRLAKTQWTAVGHSTLGGKEGLVEEEGVHVVARGSIWKGDGSLHGDVFYWGRTKAWPRSLRHVTCMNLDLEGQETPGYWGLGRPAPWVHIGPDGVWDARLRMLICSMPGDIWGAVGESPKPRSPPSLMGPSPWPI